MAVLIKDPEADNLIRQLAARTGETITEAVRVSVKQRLDRVGLGEHEIRERKRQLRLITNEFDALPRTGTDLSDDEILGYNDAGHFD